MLISRPFTPKAATRHLLLTCAAIASLTAASASLCAQQAQPGDPLYPVPGKEDAQPAQTPTPAKQPQAPPPAFARPPALPPMPAMPAAPSALRLQAAQAPQDMREEALPAPPLPPGETPPGPFDPPGLRLGAFRLHETIEADGVVSDNIDQTTHDRKAAAGVRIAPSIRLKSIWPRHGLDIRLGSEFIQWSRHGEREATASASARLRLDIRYTTYATIETTYDLGEEDGASGRLQHDLGLKTTLTHEAGRLRLSLGADVTRRLYTRPLSGGSSGYDDDYTQPAAHLRLTYRPAAILHPYAEIGADRRIHDRNRDSSGIERNSTGAYVEAGVEFAPDAIWSGSAGLRLALRDYDDPAYRTAHGVGLNASVTWRPTRITRVKLASSFDIDETTTSGSSGARKYTLAITPQHALRDNLLLKGNLGLEYTGYIGIPDHEWLLNAGAEISWTFHRGYELVGAWGAERQWSTFAGADYLENRFTIGLRYKL